MTQQLTVGLIVALNTASLAATAAPDITAKWIWHAQDDVHAYNDTIAATKRFDLPKLEKASLIITADTIYRLMINGEWVNDGPCRSWPEHYQYDVLDVTSYLKKGENEIVVIAKYFGVGTFHQIPQQAGLLAQLDVTASDGTTQRIVSDETWTTRRASGWLANTPKRCIQMGPYEVYDARLEDAGDAAPAAVLYAATDGPWKDLNPRDCPPLTRKPFALKSLVQAKVVDKAWRCYAFPTARLIYPGLIEANGKVSMASAVATTVVADQAMDLHTESPGCTVTVNGQKADNGVAKLQAGPNFLLMVVTNYFGHWEKDTELRLHETSGYALVNPVDGNAENPWCFVPFNDAKHIDSDMGFSLRPIAEQQQIKEKIQGVVDNYLASAKDSASLQQLAGPALRILSTADELMDDPDFQFAARKVLEEAAQVDNPDGLIKAGGKPTVITPSAAGDVELVYDLGEQNVGYYHFTLEAEAGLIVDLAEVEYIAADGRVQHTGTYRNSMRYICKEGRNEFLSLDRRSGRFVFITLRNQTKPVKFEHFQLIESTYPVNPVGAFACSDPKLDKIWEISARTLKLCMEDTYTDCPLYEQTHWVGDARNEGLIAFTAFGAEDLARRCILLTGHSLEHYPIALCQTPSAWGTLIPAWSFLWGISVWDYYEYTADAEFLREVWPMVVQNLKGSETFMTDRGLFSGPFWNFFDWSGLDDNHSTVTHNTLLMVGAIDAAAQCAGVLKDAEAAAWLKQLRAKAVESANALYNKDHAAYPDSIHEDGVISDRFAVHSNFLALLYDAAPEGEADRMLEQVLNPAEGTTKVGSPFALLYQLQAMEKYGKQDEIIRAIYRDYEPMLDEGATTVWESFATGTTGGGGFPTRSHCHAWSSGPIHFLNRIVLGILPTAPGGTAVIISPRPSGLAWAKGASASAKGPVSVEWKLEGKTLKINAKAPDGVRLNFQTNDALKDYKVLFNGEMK